ncbi:hypothetical protein QAD02_005700 [Eretmocerus hayati]|uniref:Uncharacterized protein n=1 Tax=Eretmocerus hayati TaxID=131215 RepID=A0ACC2NT94_9HYME|nr:hypothetical protein QAD02_005700 [Eretmocerus hayati]
MQYLVDCDPGHALCIIYKESIIADENEAEMELNEGSFIQFLWPERSRRQKKYKGTIIASDLEEMALRTIMDAMVRSRELQKKLGSEKGVQSSKANPSIKIPSKPKRKAPTLLQKQILQEVNNKRKTELALQNESQPANQKDSNLVDDVMESAESALLKQIDHSRDSLKNEVIKDGQADKENFLLTPVQDQKHLLSFNSAELRDPSDNWMDDWKSPMLESDQRGMEIQNSQQRPQPVQSSPILGKRFKYSKNSLNEKIRGVERTLADASEGSGSSSSVKSRGKSRIIHSSVEENEVDHQSSKSSSGSHASLLEDVEVKDEAFDKFGDSNQTLKYLKGDGEKIVELVKGTKVYIDAADWKALKEKTYKNQSTEYARCLLRAIIKDDALKMCSLTGQSSRGPTKVGDIRPGLDKTAVDTIVDKICHIVLHESLILTLYLEFWTP